MPSEDNPYISFVGMMRTEGAVNNPVPFFIGHVVSASPLRVQIGDIVIEREGLLVNELLLRGYTRHLQMGLTSVTGITGTRSGGSGYDSFTSHNHDMNTLGIPDGTFTALDGLSAGDKVLTIISSDQQQIVVVCKLI